MLSNKNRIAPSGFTLIEMLVALAVVAIALAAISSNYINSFDVADSLKSRTLARWIAENHLVKLKLETPWPKTGSREGTLVYASQNWSWQEVVRPTPDRDFRRIAIEVRRKDAEAADSTLVGYARNPKPAKLALLK